MKSVQIWSFFWYLLSCIPNEYRKIQTRKEIRIWTLFMQWIFILISSLNLHLRQSPVFRSSCNFRSLISVSLSFPFPLFLLAIKIPNMQLLLGPPWCVSVLFLVVLIVFLNNVNLYFTVDVMPLLKLFLLYDRIFVLTF